jgi:pyruvate/2-oxoglutarate dehydrogenase complex dihydrolipoamide acyltransferase (E2) component
VLEQELDKIGTFREIKHDFDWSVEFLNNVTVRNRIYGLIELDVTKARKFIPDHKEKTGETLSFTGWVIKCIAQAVSENAEVQGYRKGKNKIVVFDDVDVAVVIEREMKSERVPMGYVVRKANEKSFRQIHEEIRSAQKQEIHGEVLGSESLPRLAVLVQHLPSFLRKFGWWKFRRDPFLKKQVMGTIAVTAVGMFGIGRGWPIMMGFHSLEFGIGGISNSRSIEDPSDLGEYLSMTVMFDEEVTYGAPAARFISRLSELMKAGFGLE